jgi:hypothetical protein
LSGRWSERRYALLALVAVVAVVGAATAVVVTSRRAEPRLAGCQGEPATLPLGYTAGVSKWSEDVYGPRSGESVVEVAETPADLRWHYRRIKLFPAYHEVVEGVYQPGAVDERTLVWRPPGEADPYRDRSVVIGNDAWNDSSLEPGWEHCSVSPRPAFAHKDIVFGYDPGAPESACSIGNCDYVIGPGSRVPVRNRVESVVAGEHLTTYEVVARFADRPSVDKLRATITLDEARRLRGGKVWDAATGTVYFTLEAGPAPGNPPIVDPSGQPPFSSQPPPAPPTTATVVPTGG